MMRRLLLQQRREGVTCENCQTIETKHLVNFGVDGAKRSNYLRLSNPAELFNPFQSEEDEVVVCRPCD